MFALIIVVFPFSAKAQETNALTINTPEDYINYLKQNRNGLNSQIINNESSNILQKFTSLSKENQQKFVDYMNNPEAIKSIFNAMQSGENADLYNGDIKVRVTKSKPANTTSAFTTIYKPEAETEATTFGITVISTKVYVQYSVTSGKITQILNAGGLVTRNWVPFANISVKEDKPFITSDKNRAYETVYFTWNFIHKSLGAVIGTGTHTMWGFPDGSYNSSFTKS